MRTSWAIATSLHHAWGSVELRPKEVTISPASPGQLTGQPPLRPLRAKR
ncbi:hypothetical protein ACQ4M4_26610 [Leptolyngbya sp. AN02str]